MNMNRAKCGIMSLLLKEVNTLSMWTWDVRIAGYPLGWIDRYIDNDKEVMAYEVVTSGGNCISNESDFMKALAKFIPRAIKELSKSRNGMVGCVGCVTATNTYFSIDSEEYDDKEDLLFYRLNHDDDSNLHFMTAFELNYGVLMGTIELVK